MSASNERKEQQAVRRQERAAQEAAAARRSNLIYGLIAAAFVLLVAATLVWRSNVIGRTATAVVIDGQKYTAAEMEIYYQNNYRTFLQQYSYFVSYLGLDTRTSLREQTVSDTAASMLGIQAGGTWHDYFVDEAVKQMTIVQNALKEAEAEGFVYPASVQTQYDESLRALESSAAAAGKNVDAFLKNSMGSVMTKSVYMEQVLRMLRYSAYLEARQDRITYTMDELEAFYREDPQAYDKVAYEYVTVSGAAPDSQDAEGNVVEPTEDEKLAAMDIAKKNADEIAADVRGGKSMKDLADAKDGANYYSNDKSGYNAGDMGDWLFDSARRSGDVTVIESGESYQVLHFQRRFRDEEKTVDVRHILVNLGTAALAEGDEGYEAEQAQLAAEAHAGAEAILNEWKAGPATEDSFAALAIERSGDGGSAANGGLYTGVYTGQMVAPFNDWCFDAARKSGDTGIVDTTYGSHVMYYVADNLPNWAADIRSEKVAEFLNEWAADLTIDADTELKSFGLSFLN